MIEYREVSQMESSKVVVSEYRSIYERKGYVIFRSVIDHDLVNECSDHVAWLQAKHPDVRPEDLGHRFVTNDPFWIRLVGDDKLLDIAEQFIGPNIALFASHYISKPPGDGKPVLWHQDGSYWPLEPMDVVTLWLAVDDSTPENGCMRVIPRTHLTELKELMESKPEDNNALLKNMDPSFVEEFKAVDVVLKAGDVSVHHPNIIHGSKANLSTIRRCGLTIRYIPTYTRIVSDKPWPSAFLLRGKAMAGVNEYLPFPEYREKDHMRFRGCEGWN